MAKSPLNRKVTREIQLEAEQIARSLQKPGQTKEQTRLIAKGIQQGIETYRRQQAEKARDFDKELKKLKRQENTEAATAQTRETCIVYRQHWLPWLLLMLSLSAVGYLLFTADLP